MKDKSTIYGLNPKKVVELLKIGKDADSTPIKIDQHRSDLICEKLNETVPIYFSTEQNPSDELRSLRDTIAVLSGEPIRKLLEKPNTDITLVRMIKDFGRKLSDCSESEAEQQISNTIYYAAIAHALVFHNLKITNHSYEKLRKSFDHLSGENWIPKYLLVLFVKAAELSKVRME